MWSYHNYGKRWFDFTIACLAAVVLAPLMLAIAALVRCKLGRPVLFRQQRPGIGGHPFRLIKFRTMIDACDAGGQLLPDTQRLTPFGRWLRSTSLDELPELWNVVLGDMSLVGPRPLLTEYLDLYTPQQARRHRVRPGITGLAQVRGRNAISWEDRFRYDVEYVERVSFLGDLKILIQTVVCVCRRTGVSASFHVTMPPFAGAPSNKLPSQSPELAAR